MIDRISSGKTMTRLESVSLQRQRIPHYVHRNPIDRIFPARYQDFTHTRRIALDYAPFSSVIASKFLKILLPSGVWLTSGCHWSP
jgi:hypothetical protein